MCNKQIKKQHFQNFECQAIFSDNIPFNSREVRTVANEWNFQTFRTIPEYRKSNRLAEKGVSI